MIMQEFETRRNQTIPKSSVFDNVPILVPTRKPATLTQQQTSFSTSTAPQFSFDETPIAVSNKKPQGPFPYLKRKSIRVDLVLKQQKEQAKKKNSAKKSTKKVSNNELETLRKEKKALKEENSILKGRLMQMELLFKELIRNPSTKTVKNQECQTESKSTSTSSCQTETIEKKQTFSECSKCHKCIRSSYLKHHQRFCGNTNLKKLLSEKDLKKLQIIRMNSSSSSATQAPKNNWRKTRQEFLNQIKKDKLRQCTIQVILPKKRINKY